MAISPIGSWQARARETLKAKPSGGLAQALDSIAPALPLGEPTAVLKVVRAAVAAVPAASEGIAAAGLGALASGGACGSGPLAALILNLADAAGDDKARWKVTNAALQAAAKEAPDVHVRQQAGMLKAGADGAQHLDASLAASRAGLKAMAGAGDYLSFLAFDMVCGDDALSHLARSRKAAGWTLRGLGRTMAEAVGEGGGAEERGRVAKAALAYLAGVGDQVGRMADKAVAAMKYSDTSRNAALAALRIGDGAPLQRMAVAARDGLGAAVAQRDGSGRWVDEKTPFARACLGEMSAQSDFAAMGVDMIDACRFTHSVEGVGQGIFAALAGGTLDDRQAASVIYGIVSKGHAGDDSSSKYQDDRSGLARVGAAWLRDHGAEENTRKWGGLLHAVLAPGKFTDSNDAIAKVGFNAVGHPFNDAGIAAALRKMVKGALNTNNALYKFQADKSTIIAAAMPVLDAPLASKRVLGLWREAGKDVTFASTGETLALDALSAIEGGQDSDRDLARLAVRMVKNATAGQTSAYDYADDKTGVALRTARHISQTAKDPTVKGWADTLLGAVDGTSFTSTCATLAEDLLGRAGHPVPDARGLARLGRKMADKATASYSTTGRYYDDKRAVAANFLSLVSSAARDDATRIAAAVAREAIRSARYTESTGPIASKAFKALEAGELTRVQAAQVAVDCIGAAIWTTDEDDRGDVSVAVVATLARMEMAHARTAVALDAARAMLEGSNDTRSRILAAQSVLSAWAAHDGAGPIDGVALVESAASSVEDSSERLRMLREAVPVLCAMKGEQEAKDAKAFAASASSCEKLLAHARSVALRPTQKEQVERMVERLNSGTTAGDSKVQDEGEYVIVAGIRVKKRGTAPGEAH
ncbi:MAG: hypothetical protein FJX76_12475 [Armatimonadetes bacterium]|nr:hypothetical protein [Armatimonadota bacterium]